MMRPVLAVVAGLVTFLAVWLGLASLLGGGAGVVELSILAVVAVFAGVLVARAVHSRRQRSS
jgi:hypothetical protein